MGIYFTADTHFNHTKIMEYENRPFNSVEEMNETLINNWNSKVKHSDDVYILGDFAWGKKEDIEPILKRLKGRKYLIRGNHDYYLKDKSFDVSLFEWVKDYHRLKWNKMKFILFHYPIQSWDCKSHGSIHLFGHVHSQDKNEKLSCDGFKYNVGVDVNNFTPVSIEEVIEKYNTLKNNNSINNHIENTFPTKPVMGHYRT